MNKKYWEEILIAFSAANLLFITTWRELIYQTSENYHIKYQPFLTDYAAIILNVIITATIFLGGVWISRLSFKGKTPIFVKIIFLGIFGLIVNSVRLNFLWSASSLYLKIGILICLLILGIFIWVKDLGNETISCVQTILLILSPFVLITFSQTIIAIYKSNPTQEISFSEQFSKIQSIPQKTSKVRVVWIILDEFDYNVTFDKQPSIVSLPEFERLKNESLFATKAVSPADSTLKSMTSLITGKVVEETQYTGKTDLFLNFQDKTISKFSTAKNIFSDVKAMNGNTAIVGWYHSYCRVIGQDLSACHWEGFDTLTDIENTSFFDSVSNPFSEFLNIIPFGSKIFHTNQENRRISNYIKRHNRLVNAANTAVTNPNLDLILLHLPIPHYPFLYDKNSKTFGQKTSYLDNLVLADDVLGDLRKNMENTDLWNDSVVIVSSDHPLRRKYYKNKGFLSEKDFNVLEETESQTVPFFLKLKNQQESIIYEKPFNTLITHDLILDVMNGNISTLKDAQKWLDSRANLEN